MEFASMKRKLLIENEKTQLLRLDMTMKLIWNLVIYGKKSSDREKGLTRHVAATTLMRSWKYNLKNTTKDGCSIEFNVDFSFGERLEVQCS